VDISGYQRVSLYSPRWPLPAGLPDLVLLCRGLAFRPELCGHLYAVQHGVLSGVNRLWKFKTPVSGHAREDIGTFHTCWINLLVDEQLKKGLWDVEPEPDGFSFPWEVLEVDLIYDTPISVRSGLSQKQPPAPPAYRIL